MSEIHVSINGLQSTSSDEQIRSLWQQGRLDDSALYWQAGMTEWRPLREYFTSAPASSPSLSATPSPAARSRGFTFTKDPTALTVFVKTMLWISLVLGVISLLSDFAQFNLAASGSITKEAAQANDARQQIIGIVQLLAFIVTGVAFLMWIYRANLNVRGFGAGEMKFTPGWSVGYYFIPFVNLVRPYQAMKEIWKCSANPGNWRMQPGSALLGWWWALWLISGFLGQISFRLSLAVDSPDSLQTATVASMISNIVDIPLCLIAISLISKIYARQRALASQIA
jgi:hypothetical protein